MCPHSQTRKWKRREGSILSKSPGESQAEDGFTTHHPQVTLICSNHHIHRLQDMLREQHVQELLSTNTAGIRGKPSSVLQAVGTRGHPAFWSQGGGGDGTAGQHRTLSVSRTGVHVLTSVSSSSCFRARMVTESGAVFS